MNEENKTEVARREFLKTSAAAAVGISCLSFDLREAVAQARQAGKPLFTENNLNRLIRANPLTSKNGQAIGREALQDVKGFIRKYFHLTATQQEELESITEEDKNRIFEALKRLIDTQGEIFIQIVRDIKTSNERGSAAYVKAGFSEPLPEISIDVGCTTDGGVSCHFKITKKS